MPTSATFSFSNTCVDPVFNADDAMDSMVVAIFAASQTLAAGTVLGIVTTGGKYTAYASGNADGSQNPVGILRRAVTTDGSGNITTTDEWGVAPPGSSVYTQGAFRCADLVGLDANAVTKLGGHLIGSLTTGIFSF